ncbi:MAG: ABC transporter ATP-binding protein [Bacilli bacterium]|nr:ABC transporter ATP-binding protein [Bacilli bacterium]MDD7315662.1 ABC transporter ATP-binding protein [Bacilli bacterium]MDY4052420.1 ABC transporter ATP-binding protein [Bacilli bacterium]
MLSIKNYSKTYGNGKKAVDNLSLEVEDGDLFAFIGHNGAGKSTTIKSVVGILPFEEGDIYIGGLSIKDHPVECKKMIGYIPDNPDLYDSLTGIGYLNFIGDLFDVSTEKRKEIIEKYATMFELHNDLNNFISSYSHGMKQKLALISAFIHEPKLLVLDEPFVGLDPKATFLVKKVMKEFCENGGSIFFSTHILEVAQKLCNKIAIIKKGKLVTYGDMETVTKEASLEEVFMELVDNA